MLFSLIGNIPVYLLALTIHNQTGLSQVEAAVGYLVDDYYQLEQHQRGADWGVHPLVKDRWARLEVALAAHQAGAEHGIDPLLLLSIAWKESTLTPSVARLERLGAVGEKGLMQLHGVAAKGCNLNTVAGQFRCGANWQAYNIKHCKDVEAGLARYMQGFTCKPERKGRLWRKARSRMRLYHKLQKAVKGWQTGTSV